VPERGRLARKRGDALKNVESEINIEFNLNAFRLLRNLAGEPPALRHRTLKIFGIAFN
jgi:hypothetical protein